MKKSLDLQLCYKPHKKIFTPLRFYQLDNLILSDRHIGTYVDQYQRGNLEYFVRLRNLTLYETTKPISDQDLVRLSKRVEVLDTMLAQLNPEKFSQIVHSDLVGPLTNSDSSEQARSIIQRGKHIVGQNRSVAQNNNGKHANAIKLSRGSKGRYITIDGKKRYVSEGQQVTVFGVNWVVIGDKLVNLDIGKAIIDHNGNCHIRNLTDELRCLQHGKNEWILWNYNGICIYKDKRLQIVLNGSEITIEGKRLINLDGNLCIAGSETFSQQNTTVQTGNLVVCDKSEEVITHILNSKDGISNLKKLLVDYEQLLVCGKNLSVDKKHILKDKIRAISAWFSKPGMKELEIIQGEKATLNQARWAYSQIKKRSDVDLVVKQAAKFSKRSHSDYAAYKQEKALAQQEANKQREVVRQCEFVLQELKIDTQSCIINSLEQSKDHKAVAAGVWQTVDRIYTTAYKYNCDIHPEVDFQIANSLGELEVAANPQEFTYHLATVDHLLNDIQAKMAQALGKQPTVLERSPELLSRAVIKYFEYLAPTESEIAFICDLAYYVSDVTVGTEYLAPEVYEQRIQQFWTTIDSLSLDNLSQLSAESVIDATMYVAARASWAWGATKAIPLLKNLKTMSSSTASASAAFADKFVKVFDHVIGNNPAIINADGSVIWNASQEVAAEARQLVQAFDGMKDKLSDKPPAEILDDTKKVVDNESKLKTKTVGDLVKGAKPGEKTLGSTKQYELQGDFKKTLEDLKSLNPKNVKDISPSKDGTMFKGELEDGRIVIARNRSRGANNDGPPTLDIHFPGQSKKIKFRYK